MKIVAKPVNHRLIIFLTKADRLYLFEPTIFSSYL